MVKTSNKIENSKDKLNILVKANEVCNNFMQFSVFKTFTSTLGKEYEWKEDTVNVDSGLVFLKIQKNKNKRMISLVYEPKGEIKPDNLPIYLMTPKIIPDEKITFSYQLKLDSIELEPFKPEVVGEIEFQYQRGFGINKDFGKY